MENIGFHEDLLREFKSDRSCLSDGEIIDAVVAFANTDGGDLYLGVEDDGEITGLHERHYDVTQLAAFIANKYPPAKPGVFHRRAKPYDTSHASRHVGAA